MIERLLIYLLPTVKGPSAYFVQEFIEKCELLLKEAGLRELLTSRARVRLQTSHNVEHEKQQYCQIVSQLVNDNTIGRPTELLK